MMGSIICYIKSLGGGHKGQFGICHGRELKDATDGLGELVCLVGVNYDPTRVYFIDDF